MRHARAIVLTPEHVELSLTPAGLGRRFWAFFLDLLIRIVAVVTISFAAGMGLALFPGIAQAVIGTATFLIWNGYAIFFEVRHAGQTPGKKAARIRVVDRKGLPVTFMQSLVRNVSRALDALPIGYGVGAATTLLDRHNRRLGDLVADTLVIEERLPPAGADRLALPTEATSLRAGRTRQRIKNRVGLEEREFLLSLCLRADRLEEAARYDLMEAVGQHYRKKLGIEDEHLSGEKLVRGMTAVLFSREEVR